MAASPRRPKRASASTEIDFNALWDRAYVPVITELGYEPVRADQDTGALIVTQMLERLYFADLVLADTTLANGNVYYEIGIRHAARPSGCVLLGADWSRQFFDVAQMRTVRCPPCARRPKPSAWPAPSRWCSSAAREYPLWQVVRASTAAPYFFDPETLRIGRGAGGPKGAGGEFVDGGVSPHNNPSLQTLMMGCRATGVPPTWARSSARRHGRRWKPWTSPTTFPNSTVSAAWPAAGS